MKLFGFLQKEKQSEPIANESSEDIVYICDVCGRYNPLSFRFCPICGTERFLYQNSPSEEELSGIKYAEQYPFSPEGQIVRYLRELGLLHLAYKQFQVIVELENRKQIAVPLLGKHNTNDVLSYLRSKCLISEYEVYGITNWPTADPCWGPGNNRVSACVCELDLKCVYHVEKVDPSERVMTLYGCPNARSITQSAVLDQMKVEVIDYEK